LNKVLVMAAERGFMFDGWREYFNYEKWEEDGIVPREVFKQMGDLGYLCPWVEEEYGGAGADFLYSVIIDEVIGRHTIRSVYVHLHNDLVAPYIASYGNEEQKRRWLPDCVSGDKILAVAMTEPGAGSDLSAIRTKALKDGDRYILNGSKVFISNGILADLVVVAAKTDPTLGAKGISLFVVERGTPGFVRGKRTKKGGSARTG